MSETQLELQVISNAHDTATALDELESALRRVQTTLGEGVDFGETADALKKFANVIDQAFSEDVVSRFERFSNSLATIQVLSRMNFDSSGIASFAEEVNSIASGINELEWGNVVLKTVGSAASSLIGNLLGNFFSSGAETIETVWNITIKLNDETILDGKEKGWMIDELLVPALGDFVAGQLKTQIMTNGTGSVEVNVTFAVKAASDISIADEVQKSLEDETLTVGVTADDTIISDAYRDARAQSLVSFIAENAFTGGEHDYENFRKAWDSVDKISNIYGLNEQQTEEFNATTLGLMTDLRMSAISVEEFESLLSILVKGFSRQTEESESLADTSATVVSALDALTAAAISAASALSSIPSSSESSIPGHGGKFAEGGFPETGSLFVAREAGPELVGTIGHRTAVANNDQIVAGVANGVAAGQSEQNALLRQQNELLTKLFNKKFSAEIVPSAALGKVNRRSEEMYARNTGA